MILHCTFEELSAISAGAERVLAEAGSGASVVVAPPEIVADVEALLPRLIGDLSLSTLAEQQSIARAITKRWIWPPEKFLPIALKCVSNPWGSASTSSFIFTVLV